VIDGKRTGKDFVYMHLRERAEVEQGDRVRTGQRIGEVGETGNATGCHLHFELWSAPGWYEGGRFLNPTPVLRRWDRYS
jgi:murein DD-endopeptidase MepM/ murein hydrolase activator NlpD